MFSSFPRFALPPRLEDVQSNVEMGKRDVLQGEEGGRSGKNVER